MSSRQPKVCPFCGEPVDPQSPHAARQVTAWVNHETGETGDPEATGTFAHCRCVAAAQLAAPPEGLGTERAQDDEEAK